MFNVGDKVRCIDLPTTEFLNKTTIYTVEEGNCHHYGLAEPETIKVDGRYWFAYRFELVNEEINLSLMRDFYNLAFEIEQQHTIENVTDRITKIVSLLQDFYKRR